MLISTPYYRGLVPTHALGCVELATSTYGPYDLFCLETRLYNTVYQMFGRDVEIIFRSVYQTERMEIKVDIVKIMDITTTEPVPNPSIEMTDEQNKILTNKVGQITSNHIGYCLIDMYELYLSSSQKYPKDWFYSVCGYIELPTEYNPFITPNGIYLTFNPLSNYKEGYNEVVKILLDTIDRYYKEGVVYGAGNIAEKWKLERLDREEKIGKLYQPMWNDKRFAPYPTDFLLKKINGDPYIRIRVSDNLVKRHYISSKLRSEGISMIFVGEYIKIPVDNIDDAQYISALVQSSEDVSNGKVIVHSATRPSWIYLYMEAANQLLENPSCTGYQVSTIERPYIFSCIVDRNIPTETILGKLREMVLRRLASVAEKSDSPHNIIEQRYQKS